MESEESRDDATAKNADEKAAHSIPSARPNAIYVRSLLHTIKKMSPFSSLDQCPPIVASPVVVLEKLEEVLGPCERGRRPLFIAALFNI